jgi:hypothetical protein
MVSTPRDSTDDVLSLHVSGVDLDGIRERARLEAARIWGVPSSLVTVQLQNVRVASRDPFPTDLDTHSAIDSLAAFARCHRKKDPNMPAHDTL